jgi:hypothetical protein
MRNAARLEGGGTNFSLTVLPVAGGPMIIFVMAVSGRRHLTAYVGRRTEVPNDLA